ncbi:509_t:CDS:1, partial [Racocetra persica]
WTGRLTINHQTKNSSQGYLIQFYPFFYANEPNEPFKRNVLIECLTNKNCRCTMI